MIINDKETTAQEFAYDGCHKIYLLEEENDKGEALDSGYVILPIKQLEKTFLTSCGLQFISNWKLSEDYICQGDTEFCFES